jgi:cell volume regulation protein A
VVEGIPVASVLRSRRDRASALVALADGRYAVTSESIIAVGGRQAVARWCERRAERSGDPPERAWWQEVIGALIARG